MITNEWTEWLDVRVLYNGGTDRGAGRPSIDSRYTGALSSLNGHALDVRLKPRTSKDEVAIAAEGCQVNSKRYLFLKGASKPSGWPALPDAANYVAKFRLSGGTPVVERVAPVTTRYHVGGRVFDNPGDAQQYSDLKELVGHESFDPDELVDWILENRNALVGLLT